MRLRPLVPLLVACAVLPAPAAASAAVTVGVAENSPGMFADPLFHRLHVQHVRVVMSYNVMTSGDDELGRVTQYLETAKVAGIEPLVTFEHARGDASICGRRSNLRKLVCRLPTAAQYRRNVALFLQRFPYVKLIAPWNEANHFTQPTSRNPRAAAGFTNIVHSLCPTCRLVVADMLDQADVVSAARPTFRNTTAYIHAFRAALKVPRTICGIHNYSDVNRFRSTGTRALIKALGCRRYWLTETGGLYKFGSFWSRRTKKGCTTSAACQVKATRYMFSLTRTFRRIERLYVYTWFGAVTPRFDAGLVAGGRARPAYREVARHMK
jgi:hypothetical protein